MKTYRILIPIDRLKRFTKSSYKKNDLIVAFAYNNLLSSCLRVGMYRRMGSFSGVLFSRYRLSNAFQRFPTELSKTARRLEEISLKSPLLSKISSSTIFLKNRRKLQPMEHGWNFVARPTQSSTGWVGTWCKHHIVV